MNQDNQDLGEPERAAEQAMASIRRAREIVATSRSLLLGEAPVADERVMIVRSGDAFASPGVAAGVPDRQSGAGSAA